MKYERLTNRGEPFYGFEKCKTCEYGKDGCDKWCDQITGCFCRLQELEDKIESGELCEQKTCKNVSKKHPVDEFICSECGFHYENVSETREDEDGEYFYKVEFETKYCPNCGAKVEDEE